MTTKDIKKILGIISQLPKEENFRLVFTGGEPFMNQDLLELAKYATKKVCRPEILTNGTLVNENNLRELRPFIQEIQISLDYPQRFSKLHDQRRKFKGCWNKAYDALQWAYLFNIPRTVATVCHKHNLRFMPEMLSLSRSLKAELKILRYIPTGVDDKLALNQDQTRRLCKFIYRNNLVSSMPIQSLVSGNDSRCDAGVQRISIRCDSKVVPCDFISKTFGNILMIPIETIMKRMWDWRLKRYYNNKEACNGCTNFSYCYSGCIAYQLAYKNYRDNGCWI